MCILRFRMSQNRRPLGLRDTAKLREHTVLPDLLYRFRRKAPKMWTITAVVTCSSFQHTLSISDLPLFKFV